jgi:NAD(P)H-dependent flavin oxidoreductase YrpB (nitropropane dioxygenase family)
VLGLSWTTVEDAVRQVRETKRLTPRPFGVNVAMEWPQRERLAACLAEGVRVVSTFWGDPSPYIDMIRQAGAVHLHTVGSAQEARRVADLGVDAVVAQGWEAGGHVWGTVSTMVLVPSVVDAVNPLPVIAAGGIADGRGLAAALALGACAGWIGTRFLMCREANAHADYQTAVAAGAETDTVYGVVFDGGWAHAPHRALRNSTVAMWQIAGEPPHGRRPGEGDVVLTRQDGADLLRYGDDLPTTDLTGDVEPLALYAGQSSGLVQDVESAATIVRRLAEDAARVLGRLAPAS